MAPRAERLYTGFCLPGLCPAPPAPRTPPAPPTPRDLRRPAEKLTNPKRLTRGVRGRGRRFRCDASTRRRRRGREPRETRRRSCSRFATRTPPRHTPPPWSLCALCGSGAPAASTTSSLCKSRHVPPRPLEGPATPSRRVRLVRGEGRDLYEGRDETCPARPATPPRDPRAPPSSVRPGARAPRADWSWRAAAARGVLGRRGGARAGGEAGAADVTR